MMCEECGIRPACIHVVKLTDGEKTEHNLCPECLEVFKKTLPGLQLPELTEHIRKFMEQHAVVMSEAIKQEDAPTPVQSDVEAPKEEEAIPDLTCASCGMTYAQFRKDSLLGCPDCYGAFREPLETVLRAHHGSTEHVGRRPGEASDRLLLQMSIDRLRRCLSDAIAREAYEDAAEYRDEIRKLTARLHDFDEGGLPNG